MKGSAPTGGAPGNLYVVIRWTSPIFVRDNLDIVCDVPISFVQAALARIDVPTLDGKVKMKIPAGHNPANSFA
jgi:molecular chaperone DnaJ